MSIVSVEYNQQNKNLEMSFRIFTDDLEKAVNRYSGKEIYLGGDREISTADSLIYEYINDKFFIRTDEEILNLDYVGRENEIGVTWIYIEAKNAGDFSSVTVKNTMLTEIYEDQQNLVHIKKNGEFKSMALNKSLIKESAEF